MLDKTYLTQETLVKISTNEIKNNFKISKNVIQKIVQLYKLQIDNILFQVDISMP